MEDIGRGGWGCAASWLVSRQVDMVLLASGATPGGFGTRSVALAGGRRKTGRHIEKPSSG